MRNWLRWHAAVIGALVVFAVAVDVLTPIGEGFNFLIVVPMLPLLGLGLPWSVLSTYAESHYLVSGDAAFWTLYISPALLNLALHAALRKLLEERTTRTGDGSPES